MNFFQGFRRPACHGSGIFDYSQLQEGLPAQEGVGTAEESGVPSVLSLEYGAVEQGSVGTEGVPRREVVEVLGG